ncbi:putative beta-lysine N-acetyltransferase [Maribacter sp. ACAM166]|uniref:putative beta-lysine N-acetyltransferase n=1 Tax=Maribacter sp. ACAM166 TaxID=2508996 RepID=UPI0010FD5339|nr:putative beta-lysine N-acetyltransferase [Maribacter sp. ACAM166]TLP70500.1 putative beta-lysine N-acetyltransferase [Maribacter sp. ACAM166]
MQIGDSYDTVEQIEGAMLQHGDTHSRLYLMQVEQNNWDELIPKMKDLAKKKSYDKILGRVPEEAIKVFQSNGYEIEAKIPGLYNGEKAGYFLADYLEKERGSCSEQELKTIESVKTIALAANSSLEDAHFELPSNLYVRKLNKNDLFAMVHLHEIAFKSHSFPINTAEYLLELVEQNHEFYGLFQEEELLVTAIIKIHNEESNVEIVDFATHPDYKGQNLSYYLVQEIKRDMDMSEYKTIYSLVRATSYGLNITFSKHGFSLGGTLLNNTVIRNNLESMNVWYSN